MPAGIPVGCLAIGEAGAKNAALLAIAILALFDEVLAEKLQKFRQNQTSLVELKPNPIEKS
jgi:5-(carboxyamino)imidazole ribonucleotide mutase